MNLVFLGPPGAGKGTQAAVVSQVPDEVTVEMVKERLAEADCAGGYLLDGFPRNLFQAEALSKFSTLDAVVDIAVEDGKLIARLSGRRVCKACGGTYHINNLKDAKVCPDCGAELFTRADDNPETIANRLHVYHEQTSPLTAYYERLGILKRVDGSMAMEAVSEAILNKLSEKA